jgi:hypothetical protein
MKLKIKNPDLNEPQQICKSQAFFAIMFKVLESIFCFSLGFSHYLKLWPQGKASRILNVSGMQRKCNEWNSFLFIMDKG